MISYKHLFLLCVITESCLPKSRHLLLCAENVCVFYRWDSNGSRNLSLNANQAWDASDSYGWIMWSRSPKIYLFILFYLSIRIQYFWVYSVESFSMSMKSFLFGVNIKKMRCFAR